MDAADEQLRQRFRQLDLTVEQVGEAVEIVEAATSFHRGELFCSTEEVFGVEWQPYTASDFTDLRRDWRAYEPTLEDALLHSVYSKSRECASDPASSASLSTSVMSNVRPARLCAFITPNEHDEDHAEKAHLCPKTGKMGHTDTWIYVASVVLGLGFASREERVVLSKALRGSCLPGHRQVVEQHTGLNRSPYNFLLFMEQERYFDKLPGVIALPVYDVNEAKAWRGQSYSVIVLCTNRLGVTSAQMAGRIGLRDTDPNFVERASDADVQKAAALLTAVVKASAYCLENLGPPENARAAALWHTYCISLRFARGNVEFILGQPIGSLKGSIAVPTIANIPDSKFVTKINLANMAPLTGETAYPDPILLTYKSSINWTKLHHFQLMAEAEWTDLKDPAYGDGSDVGGRSERSIPDEVFVA